MISHEETLLSNWIYLQYKLKISTNFFKLQCLDIKVSEVSPETETALNAENSFSSLVN